MGITFAAWTYDPGVLRYHCAAGPVTDVHIKSGLHGAMIVYPREERLRPAREIVVVQDAVYGVPDAKGFIPGTDSTRTQRNEPFAPAFNGRLEHADIGMDAGDLVRMYFVNVGPGTAAAGVVGTVLDRVYEIFEFYVPAPGVYVFVDHDKLAYLPMGLALTCATGSVATAAH